ncbi:MAG TPA: RcnB family protein [Caulobacteraceae bacterium]|nr:RcnB family protein [Caulobacteraceae bacterium]
MKGLLAGLGALAALTLATGTAAAEEHHGHGRRGGDDGGHWARGRDEGDAAGRRRGEGRQDEGRPYDPGYRVHGGGQWDEGRGTRVHRDWDDRRYNGYFLNDRWHYGPPPDEYWGRPGFQPGFSAWRRGAILPPYYRSWAMGDWSRYHLRRPPPGYYWVRVGRQYLLVSNGSGLIFDVIPADGY